jgi:tetratricopeptide (TPR) repeat protein
MSQSAARDAALQTALGEYLGWSGDPVATLNTAVQADPGFVLGHTTIAALNSLGGATGDAPAVQMALMAASGIAGQSLREQLHLSAASAWASGEIEAAAGFWESALKIDPGDLLALRLAHDTHFYLGASEKLRDVPLAVLPAYEHAPTQRGFVLGMAAFGLQETGRYAEAERLGHDAVHLNQGDSWAIHAVAHVLEMQDRAADGYAWLHGLQPHWEPATGLAIHQWWHTGLFLIELGRFDEVLALYDNHIRGGNSSMILDLVDAAALLWRLELLGVNVGARWQDLAPVWSAYAEDHVLAFNDVHIAFTMAAAGALEAVEKLEAAIADYALEHTGTNARISSELGLPVIRAMQAFRNGDYARTVDLLAPVYKHLAPLGGSNAQRDLFIQTLGIAAFKAGRLDIGRAVMAERRRLKSGTPLAWARYATAH